MLIKNWKAVALLVALILFSTKITVSGCDKEIEDGRSMVRINEWSFCGGLLIRLMWVWVVLYLLKIKEFLA